MPSDLAIHAGSRIRSMSNLEVMRDRSRNLNPYVMASPFDRSIAAWYLTASGYSFTEIGELFEMSAATASGSVRGIRNQAYQITSTSLLRKVRATAKKQFFLTISKDAQLAHILTQSYLEMLDVEYIMGRIHGDYAIKSVALKLGERRFMVRRQRVGQYRCVCDDCKQTTLPALAGK